MVTGMDYAGPLFCVDLPSIKLYIFIYLCHCQICALGAQRFSECDRLSSWSLQVHFQMGILVVFYSDNAKTYVAAGQQLQQYLGHLASKLNFIPPDLHGG